jgi:hypothetical protein
VPRGGSSAQLAQSVSVIGFQRGLRVYWFQEQTEATLLRGLLQQLTVVLFKFQALKSIGSSS